MAEGLKVLMMGGQRVGKSSALAAVMNAFITGPGKDIFTAKDTTSLARIDGEQQTSINSKLEEVKNMLSSHAGKTILVDAGKTNKKWDYTLELTLTGTDDSMTMTFTDINGEFFEGGNFHQEEIIELVKTYDVFIVAIDTPFMMEARNEDNDLVDPIINSKYNCTESIHTFLTQIDDNDGANAKLVIFAPIKCEYWAQEGQLGMVSAAVKEDYQTTIAALKRYKSVQIEILPIQTVGSAQFCKHMEAYVFEWKEKILLFFNMGRREKCGLLPNRQVMLSDGSTKPVESGTLHEDMEAVLIPGSDIIRPNSWFTITSPTYAPHNCEQLAFHILEFMLAKVIDAKIREAENENGFIKFLGDTANFILSIGTFGLWDKLRNLFGGITLEQMQTAISQMRTKNLIKHFNEGIEILTKCNFRS